MMKNATNSWLRASFGCHWITLALFLSPGLLTMALPLHAANGSVRSIRDANLDSLVFITVKGRRENGVVDTFTSTGFIVHPGGYVLTCNHMIPAEKPEYTEIEVLGSVGGRYEHAYPLTIVRRDEQANLILLKLPQRSWNSVKSIAQAQAGSDIVALGFPVDKGLVVAPGLVTGVEPDGRWLTNAGFNPGMSGGPAFDESGAVVGIIEGGYVDSNSLNLLIPINSASSLLQLVNSSLLDSDSNSNPTALATATSTEVTPIPFPLPASALWENLRSFMRWDAFPKDYKTLLDACVINGAAAGVIYFLVVLGLYSIAPARFVTWHEWIATAGVPFSEKLAKTLALFYSTLRIR